MAGGSGSVAAAGDPTATSRDLETHLSTNGPRIATLLEALTACGERDVGRGLHSSTFQLNLSALYGIGGALRGCAARVKGVLGGV